MEAAISRVLLPCSVEAGCYAYTYVCEHRAHWPMFSFFTVHSITQHLQHDVGQPAALGVHLFPTLALVLSSLLNCVNTPSLPVLFHYVPVIPVCLINVRRHVCIHTALQRVLLVTSYTHSTHHTHSRTPTYTHTYVRTYTHTCRYNQHDCNSEHMYVRVHILHLRSGVVQ